MLVVVIGWIIPFFFGSLFNCYSITALVEEFYGNNCDYTSSVFFWTNIEIALGVTTACIPTYRPLWLHWNHEPTNAIRLSRSRSSRTCSFPDLRAFCFRRRDSLGEGDHARLKQDTSVSTVIEAGKVGGRDQLDTDGIAARHDIRTHSKVQPFDQIV
ncbi:MAG: hypothetical protein Q9173_004387 [Seirophora scorigena]